MARVYLVALLLLSGCFGGTPDPAPDAPPVPARFTSASVFPGDYDLTSNWSRPLQAGNFTALPDQLIAIVSPRGGSIAIGLVRPDTDKPVPVILLASPYPSIFSPSVALVDNLDQFARPLVENFVPHGYAVAIHPVRGTGSSGGCMDFYGPGEEADLEAAIEWLGTQPWSNGKVGTYGHSYRGATGWEAAGTGNEHLATIVVSGAFNDLFTAMSWNGTGWAGTVPLGTAFYANYGVSRRQDASGPNVLARACPDVILPLLGAVAYAGATGERDPLGLMAQRNKLDKVLANYNGSILIAQGFRDTSIWPHDQLAALPQLAARNITTKLMLGPWEHTPPDIGVSGSGDHRDDAGGDGNPVVRRDWSEILLHWYDHYLKGLDVDLGPPVQVADTSLRWRNEDQWPPADATPRVFYLNAPAGQGTPATSQGNLFDQPSSTTATVTLLADPTWQVPFIEPGNLQDDCEVCLSFRTEPLRDDLRFAGTPRIPMTVTPSSAGGRITGLLYSENQTSLSLLAFGQIDLRFADGTSRSRPVVPGAPLVVRLQLEPTDAVVPAGSRLVLRLAQGSLGTGNDSECRMTWAGPATTPTPMALQVGGQSSSVVLQTFTRDGSSFFDAPTSSPGQRPVVQGAPCLGQAVVP